MQTAVIFPGQWTQRTGMGAAWREHPAWRVVEEAEATTGEPLGHLLCEADEATLARTREAQLAILLTSLVAWEAVRGDIEAPVAFAGHSLGQVTALIAAGVLDLATGIEFAAVRASATQRAADDHPGRMVALLGADLEQAEAIRAAEDNTVLSTINRQRPEPLRLTDVRVERHSPITRINDEVVPFVASTRPARHRSVLTVDRRTAREEHVAFASTRSSRRALIRIQ